MNIISFAWTTPAIRARRKFCTRRDWDDEYVRQFNAGDVVQAFDKVARNGGRRICLVRLTDIYRERACDVPDEDWEFEGFAYLTEIGAPCGPYKPIDIWRNWKGSADKMVVIRFDYEIEPLFSWREQLE